MNRSRAVLVGDDDPEVRRAIAEVLHREGFEVIEAADRDRAVEIYLRRAAEIGVVVLDMSDPGLSPEDALARIRARNPSARLVLITGNASQDTVERTLQSGFDAFVPKPFTVDELVEPMHRLVDPDDDAPLAA